MADFQMSFAVATVLSRGGDAQRFAHLAAYRDRLVPRPAYQRGVAQGGPVMMG